MSMDYKSSGVDTEAGQQFVKALKDRITSTHSPGVIGGVGGFGALFRPDWQGYEDPVLVSGTDGVGTKLELARASGLLDGVGHDLVAMCANDILTLGAEGLFFLDYLSVESLKSVDAERVVSSVVDGCRLSGLSLVGGETAEHPGVMEKGQFDMAGFCVGIVDRPRVVDGTTVTPGDRIIGVTSSGIHSNGFSLVRRVLEKKFGRYEDVPVELMKSLLAPTVNYSRLLLPVIKNFTIKAMVHVTGGGFYENVPRVLTAQTAALFDYKAWAVPLVMTDMCRDAGIDEAEMYAVFNMGVGYMLVVSEDDHDAVLDALNKGDAVTELEDEYNRSAASGTWHFKAPEAHSIGTIIDRLDTDRAGSAELGHLNSRHEQVKFK